jgi:hypothetical protein
VEHLGVRAVEQEEADSREIVAASAAEPPQGLDRLVADLAIAGRAHGFEDNKNSESGPKDGNRAEAKNSESGPKCGNRAEARFPII